MNNMFKHISMSAGQLVNLMSKNNRCVEASQTLNIITYCATKKTFIQNVRDDSLENKLSKALHDVEIDVTDEERRSWKNSLGKMSAVLSKCILSDDCGVAIEYVIQSPSDENDRKPRIDLIITGYAPNNKLVAMIIELKQWEYMKPITNDNTNVVSPIDNGKQKKHPSYQSGEYVRMLTERSDNVKKQQIALKSCSFLHNYRKVRGDVTMDVHRYVFLKDSPMFVKDSEEDLCTFIDNNIVRGDELFALYSIDSGIACKSNPADQNLVDVLHNNKRNMATRREAIRDLKKRLRNTSGIA